MEEEPATVLITGAGIGGLCLGMVQAVTWFGCILHLSLIHI